MYLTADEFIRRFTQHILPKGFVRIRHFGICAPTNKVMLAGIRNQLMEQCPIIVNPVIYPHWDLKSKTCPKCKNGLLENIATILPIRGSPFESHSIPWK